jgi:hypothetical protein
LEEERGIKLINASNGREAKWGEKRRKERGKRRL